MKNLGTLVLGLLIGALAMYFYCCKSGEVDAMEPVKPKGVITEAQAKVLDANWTNQRKAAVDSAAGKPDNRSAWWSLDDMSNYLDYAKNQSHELGYTMNGVRVYLGVYGKDAGPGKAGYTTMFIAPTGDKTAVEGTSNFAAAGNGDVPGGDPLNDGGVGDPPSANYPQ